jgi:hypothetical protein
MDHSGDISPIYVERLLVIVEYFYILYLGHTKVVFKCATHILIPKVNTYGERNKNYCKAPTKIHRNMG